MRVSYRARKSRNETCIITSAPDNIQPFILSDETITSMTHIQHLGVGVSYEIISTNKNDIVEVSEKWGATAYLCNKEAEVAQK